MAQFVLKIEKLSHIIGARESRDLRSPSPIIAPGLYQFPYIGSFFRNILPLVSVTLNNLLTFCLMRLGYCNFSATNGDN